MKTIYQKNNPLNHERVRIDSTFDIHLFRTYPQLVPDKADQYNLMTESHIRVWINNSQFHSQLEQEDILHSHSESIHYQVHYHYMNRMDPVH